MRATLQKQRVVKFSDVNPFPANLTVQFEATSEPSAENAEVLLRRRLSSSIESGQIEIVKFQRLSGKKIGEHLYSLAWMAEIHYLKNETLPLFNIENRAGDRFLYHGTFTFFQINGKWLARLC